MKVEITSEDITLAQLTEHSCGLENYRSTSCPLARALKRAFSRPVYVDGTSATTCFISPFTGRMFKLRKMSLPPIAQKFTLDYDLGRAVQPITFTLP